MPLVKDLTDQTFGALHVLRRTETPAEEKLKPGFTRQAYWLCECECGALCTKSAADLRKMKHPNCGCMRQQLRQQAIEASRRARKKNRIYAMSPEESELRVATLTKVHTCPRCGGAFESITDDWGYQMGGKWYCSWRCLRAQQRDERKE